MVARKKSIKKACTSWSDAFGDGALGNCLVFLDDDGSEGGIEEALVDAFAHEIRCSALVEVLVRHKFGVRR